MNEREHETFLDMFLAASNACKRLLILRKIAREGIAKVYGIDVKLPRDIIERIEKESDDFESICRTKISKILKTLDDLAL